jgi:large subunit ribosomal protein L24
MSPKRIRNQTERKGLSAPLSSELQERYRRRSFPVRKGDTVKIMRGDFTGIEGKVNRVDRDRGRLFVEGLSREKVSGTSALMTVHSSKVTITNLNLSDKWRADVLEGEKTRVPVEEITKKVEDK